VNHARPVITITLAALAVGCASTPPRATRARTSLDRLIAADVACADADCEPRRCGFVPHGYDQLAERDAAASTCLTEALATCAAARVDGLARGIDSGPFPWSAVVMPPDPHAPDGGPRAACHIVLYTDLRADFYGSGVVRAEVCGRPGAEPGCTPYWEETYAVCRRFAEPVPLPGGETAISSECTRLPIGWVTPDGTGR
jgi:hypothetical protein